MSDNYDVLIIGGGATGGGTVLDLALRGLRVARWAASTAAKSATRSTARSS